MTTPDHSLQRLLGLLGPNWRFFTCNYGRAQFIELVGFYLPNTTPSERESLAKELESLFFEDGTHG